MSSDEIVHRVRASVFAQEAEWRLVDDRLVWNEAGKTRAGDSGVLALDQVDSVRLTNEPSRVGPRMFCRLRTRDGAIAMIASMHTASVFSNQDRGVTYKALVRTLVARIAVANPKARFLTGITPIVCVGETLAEREAGAMQAVIKRQLAAVIHVNGHCISEIVVAYETVWAIGTGKTASAAQAQEVHALLRAQLKAASSQADRVAILYGGSMNAANAAELLAQPDVDGGLVGGASLKAPDFLSIIAAAR